MACDCIDRMNKRMADRNSRLVTKMSQPFERDADGSSGLGEPFYTPALVSEKIDPLKNDLIPVVASHCPFCGVRYVPDPASVPPADQSAGGARA